MIINSFSSLFLCPRGPDGSSSGSAIHHVAQTRLAAGSGGLKQLRLIRAFPSLCHAVAVGIPVLLASLQQRFPCGSFALQHIHPGLPLAALNSV